MNKDDLAARTPTPVRISPTPAKLSRKGKLAAALESARILPVFRAASRGCLMVFTFHRVAQYDGAPTQFDESTISVDSESFREHLLAIRSYADPVSESDLLAAIYQQNPLPRRGFMITFDDGYKDNATIAAPILKELGIPATFYVATQAIEHRTLGWWDQIYWILKNANKKQITVRGVSYDLTGGVSSVGEQLTDLYKASPFEQVASLLEELATASECSAPSLKAMDDELMSWDDLRTLVGQGFTVGSHTHSHPVLSRIPLETQRSELIKSKALIESHLGVPVRTLAYPVGGYEHFNIETMRIAKECGYEAAFSFHTGANNANSLEPFNIKRVSQSIDLPSYAGVFSMPWLFAPRACRSDKPTAYEEKKL